MREVLTAYVLAGALAVLAPDAFCAPGFRKSCCKWS